MNPYQEFIFDLLPPEKKHRNNGWYFFNCPCCYHTEDADKKRRGNILFEGDNIVYQCFNCKYKWVLTPESVISKKVATWLKDLGATTKDIQKFYSLFNEFQEKSVGNVTTKVVQKREIRSLPTNYKSVKESLIKGETHPSFTAVMRYITERNPRLLGWADLMWAENQYNFLIPCYEYGEVVGYSLRKLADDINNKYIHYIPHGYIFNYDNLLQDRKYEIICEGQSDALAINGVSILSNIFTPDRLKRILPFTNDKEIILLPDRDRSGKKMIQQVLDENLPFSVSFPNWEKGIKDAEEAVKKYGRLYTIYSIISSKESNKDMIKMKSMKWFNI